MKKHILFLGAMLVFALSSNAQSLLGLPFSGDVGTFVKGLQKKGFTLTKGNVATDNSFIMKGELLGSMCEVFVFGTSTTKQVMKLVAYTPNQDDFYTLSNRFEHIHELLVAKYGTPKGDCVEFFRSPYERGDGYEMTAISVKKYVRMCPLGDNEPNLSVFMAIDKYPQVKMIWENPTNVELNQKERKVKAVGEL